MMSMVGKNKSTTEKLHMPNICCFQGLGENPPGFITEIFFINVFRKSQPEITRKGIKPQLPVLHPFLAYYFYWFKDLSLETRLAGLRLDSIWWANLGVSLLFLWSCRRVAWEGTWFFFLKPTGPLQPFVTPPRGKGHIGHGNFEVSDSVFAVRDCNGPWIFIWPKSTSACKPIMFLLPSPTISCRISAGFGLKA